MRILSFSVSSMALIDKERKKWANGMKESVPAVHYTSNLHKPDDVLHSRKYILLICTDILYAYEGKNIPYLADCIRIT